MAHRARKGAALPWEALGKPGGVSLSADWISAQQLWGQHYVPIYPPFVEAPVGISQTFARSASSVFSSN